MKDFENLSINQIFENRKFFIPETGKQLQKKTFVELDVAGEKLNIDYRDISLEKNEKENKDPVILLPGFGSGWEGISELGFSLTCEGRRVIMPSLPGYGNSSNPSEKYYKTDSFDNEAEIIIQLIKKLGKGQKFHLIGHSMGSEIMAMVAEKYPDEVSSLVLLNPAGVEDQEKPIAMGSKFVFSGIHTAAEFSIRMAFSGEKDYENELKKYIPKPQSPFSRERITQRIAEWQKLSKGNLLKRLKNTDVPIVYISGKLDTLFPAGDEGYENSQLEKIIESVKDKTKIQKSVMEGLRHNTTIAPDEITAANIDHYLEEAEKM